MVRSFLPHQSPPQKSERQVGGAVQNRLGPLTLGGDQELALLMHNLQDRAASQQVLVPGILADVGTALAGGVLAHLIADRIAQVRGDRQVVGRVPGPRGRDRHRAIVVVTDAGPWDGHFAEGGREGVRSRTAALDAAPAVTLPPLEDEFLVGLLDEGPEEPALDLQAGLRDERLDLIGEMLILVGPGQSHLQFEFE